MWPLNIILPAGLTVQLMPRHLWLAGAVLASLGVFASYLGLLNRSVEQGASQWRAAQEAATSAQPPVRVLQARAKVSRAKRADLGPREPRGVDSR